MSKIKKTVFFIGFLLFFISLVSNVLAQTQITTCTQITQPGEYVLVNDIIDSSASTCIDIQANDVILDCQGHTIDGTGSSSSLGIQIYRSDSITTNITIKNCVLTDWGSAIYLYNSNSNTLTDITANSNRYYGLELYNSNSNTLTNITTNFNNIGLYLGFSNFNNLTGITANSNSIGLNLDCSNSSTLINIIANSNTYGLYLYDSNSNILTDIIANSNSDYGLYLYDSDSNTLTNITANSNNVGLYLEQSSDYNTLTNITVNFNSDSGLYLYYSNSSLIKDSRFQDNTNYGIYLYSSSDNLIYNNLFNNTKNFYFDGTIYTNYWNTTRQSGTRIYSPGNEIGGNYWTNPSGTGYSDTCNDTDRDGFCDDPYVLATDNIDYLPLSNKYQVALSVTFNFNKVDFGTVNIYQYNPALNQELGIYNVTVSSPSNYVVKAYAYDWSGSQTIPANTLYIDTNETVSNLSFDSKVQLSTTNVTIDTYPASVTKNYYAFWFYAPLVKPGSYNTTMVITYEIA